MTLRLTPLASFSFILAFALSGCQISLPGVIGEQCDLNSDCDAPLICRFGHCRVECDSARDCAWGLDCLFDNEQRGACQLEADLGCVRNSDCAMPLVCTREECTNVCGCGTETAPCMSRDCAPGAACIVNDDGGTACLDTSSINCAYDSDCPPFVGDDLSTRFQICAGDGRCRAACETPADCRNGETCQLDFTFEREDGTITGPLCIYMAGSPP